MMKQRVFISLLGGAAAWPLAARAQQLGIPVIGILSSRSAGESEYLIWAFRNGLNETGYAENRNVAIEYRWAAGQYDRLPALAADLVHQQVNVLVASGGNIAAQAAKAATSTIPIVFTAVSEPVKYSLVASFNRPGGNITGVAAIPSGLETKRLQLLHELVPKSVTIAVIVNPEDQASESRISNIYTAANVLAHV